MKRKNRKKFLLIATILILTIHSSVAACAESVILENNIMYLFSDDGENWGEYTGWAKNSKGKMYYFGGEKVTGKFVVDGVCYKFSKNGYLQGKYTGWLKLNDGKKYYKKGLIVRNKWLKVGNSYSYAGVDGYIIVENAAKKIPDLPKLSKEKEKELLLSYYNIGRTSDLFSVDEFYVAAYLGCYNKQDVMMIELKDNANYYILLSSKNLGRYKIGNNYVTTSEFYPQSCSTGNYMSIEELYDEGYATDDDVIKINYYINRFLARIGVAPVEEKTFPKLKPLTDEQELALFIDYIKCYGLDKRGIYPDELRVIWYFGSYKGCEVVVIDERDSTVNHDVQTIRVAGYELSLPSGSYSLLLHRNGTFIPVEEAYEKGYLTKSDIEKIVYYSVARD